MKFLTKRVREIVLVLAMVLYLFNYTICEYFFKEDLKGWWFLKCDIHRVVIILISISFLINSKGVLKMILEIIIGVVFISVKNSNPTTVTFTDVIILILTVLFAIYSYLKNK